MLILSVLCVVLSILYELNRRSLNIAGEEIESLKKKLQDSDSKYKKVLNQKKSSEVRLGHVAEQLAPFLSNFPHDPHRARFLGQPIDFIVFNDDCIVFVEVKSGKSSLSKTQRSIRDLINEGKVVFEIYRIND